MIFVDIDGTLIDFVGTAKKFGIEMDPRKFGQWHWGAYGYPTPEEFYKKAKLQPWAKELIYTFESYKLVTTDYARIKSFLMSRRIILESPHKSIFCEHPTDMLIDDDPSQCEAWRKKGGIAYHMDLADYYKNGADPFKKFLEWWRLEK